MTETTKGNGIANSPFKFIETPAHAQNAKKEPRDQFVRVASLMVLAHNMIIRGLNSIYLQGPLVRPEDNNDFIHYALCWYQALDAHHQTEEELFFPQIEARTGEKGIMDKNIEQHNSFLAPLEAYKSYLISISATPQKFSGKHLNTLIDNFAPPLFVHLGEEISSLLELSRFGADKLPLADIWEPIARKSGSGLSKTGAFVFFFLNTDHDFEDGLWSRWPPIPVPVRAVLIRVLGRWNKGWWRFASCGYNGKMKRLHVYN
ncbi:hypothetical protein OIDMADRAFT_16072 [Oidiodendron maius Zn]|uniref:Hemerythrin-like domain-containing protein n=1 Tax=Oidiodendron maius (strain Zn) TaxID=913774 RepID=A0A0C3HYH9_OIDMZ|nr:hypothetical protein OIDMADRAFT_16072 [Oidiodendron maius Zn]